MDLAEWERLAAALHPQPGVDFLIETVLSAPEPPVLVAIGPLTNVAAALRREPRLAAASAVADPHGGAPR